MNDLPKYSRRYVCESLRIVDLASLQVVCEIHVGEEGDWSLNLMVRSCSESLQSQAQLDTAEDDGSLTTLVIRSVVPFLKFTYWPVIS